MSPIWVVIPALDESENLRELLPRVAASLASITEDGNILVVDDGSTDGTADTVRELAQSIPRLQVVSMRRNTGKALALERGFGIAIEAGAEIISMMDADGQDDPAELPRLVEQIAGGADLVTGARVVRRDRFIKRNTSKLYNRATGLLSGAPGRDFNSGFKVMRAEVARDLVPMLYGELHRYITVISHWLGYRVTEVPVTHHERMHGSSKYGIARFWRGFLDLLTVRFLLSYEHRPFHLFGGAGFISFLLGSGFLVYLTIDKVLLGDPIGGRPLLFAGVLFVIVGLQLMLFGLVAELLVYSTRVRRSADRHD